MANRKKLEELLPEEPTSPVIRRGKGIHLSTDVQQEQQAEPASPTSGELENGRKVEIEKRTSSRQGNRIERVKPGYEVRKDLLQAVKRLAVDEDRFNYEIVEEALEEYLRKKGRL